MGRNAKSGALAKSEEMLAQVTMGSPISRPVSNGKVSLVTMGSDSNGTHNTIKGSGLES